MCGLHFTRKLAVPGEGPANAELMFIGEGPGFYENEQGRPFVGQAGKLLDDLLAAIHLKRADVFITNVVKCRPPGNRDPLPDELAACSDYLDRQIEAIQPRIIVTLGRFSMAKFLPNARISDVHGQAAWVKGRLVVPMYHPAAAFHPPRLKPALKKDFTFSRAGLRLGWCKAAAGWYMGTTNRPLTQAACPCTSLILALGRNFAIEKRPRVTIMRGWMASICRSR